MAFLRRAIASAEVQPHTATNDKASPYPLALHAVLPASEHLTGKLEQQAIGRSW